jgi:nitroreductase
MTIPFSYEHSPLDLIRSRTSVRRFTGEIVAGEARQELERCCRAARVGPFSGTCRFQLIDNPSGVGTQGERVGSYGIIRGSRTYLAGAAGSNRYDLEDFGYLLELLVLKATDLGLGSCWLGGNFTRGRFAKALGLREEEIIPAVSPVGFTTKQRSLVDRVIRWGAGSRQRKSWSELFYDGENAAALSPDHAGQFTTALEMVRLAPSASNRQPWRCLKAGNTIHFYLQRFPGYRAITHTDLQRIDMGIAMAHFDLAMETSGVHGGWQVLGPSMVGDTKLRHPDAWQRCEYLVSWNDDGAFVLQQSSPH